MKKCIIIINPKSGKKGKKDYRKEIIEIFEKNNYNAQIIMTEYRGHASEIVEYLPDEIDLVVSVGGDGTFSEIMAGNFKRNKRLILAHIPFGTTNDVGTMFGYGKNILKNFELLLSGKIKKIDVCTVNNIPIVYTAGFGKFMDVPYETPRKQKEQFGYMAYMLNGVKSFLKKTSIYHLTYEVNGESHTGNYTFMIISNANRIAGINNFYKDIKLNDDQFEVLFCKIKKRKDIVAAFLKLRLGDISATEGFEFHRTNHLLIKFDEKLDKNWCIDGDELNDNSLVYEINNIRNVEVMIPNKNIDKLFE